MRKKIRSEQNNTGMQFYLILIEDRYVSIWCDVCLSCGRSSWKSPSYNKQIRGGQFQTIVEYESWKIGSRKKLAAFLYWAERAGRARDIECIASISINGTSNWPSKRICNDHIGKIGIRMVVSFDDSNTKKRETYITVTLDYTSSQNSAKTAHALSVHITTVHAYSQTSSHTRVEIV